MFLLRLGEVRHKLGVMSTWEVDLGMNRWISIGPEAAADLERAFTNSESSCQLLCDDAIRREVVFDYSGSGNHFQINPKTNVRRPVRRNESAMSSSVLGRSRQT